MSYFTQSRLKHADSLTPLLKNLGTFNPASTQVFLSQKKNFALKSGTWLRLIGNSKNRLCLKKNAQNTALPLLILSFFSTVIIFSKNLLFWKHLTMHWEYNEEITYSVSVLKNLTTVKITFMLENKFY